jgi:Family of unknown function (DUF5678)
VPQLAYDEKDIEKLNKFNKNLRWFRDHYDELKTKYKGEYVAINDSDVMGHDTNAEQLINRLKDTFGDLSAFVIEKVHEGHVSYLV